MTRTDMRRYECEYCLYYESKGGRPSLRLERCMRVNKAFSRLKHCPLDKNSGRDSNKKNRLEDN